MATLRQIIEKMGGEWLDAEFVVRVCDGHLNSDYVVPDDSWHTWKRFGDNMTTDGNRTFRLEVLLSNHRLVRERKA